MHALLASLANAAADWGIQHAVVCPGSRSAPLVIAFARHPQFRHHVISDERSAGFIALGLAQRTQAPVVLICTSGSAAYNFAPAVAEAYFQQVPLLVLTADRPPAWVDQLDGQTIRQADLFGRHVKHSWNLSPDYHHPETQWHVQRVWREAILLAAGTAPGPVHINFPFREPLYPLAAENIKPLPTRPVHRLLAPSQLTDVQATHLAEQISSSRRILVVGGQQRCIPALQKALQRFQEKYMAAVASDITGNLRGVPQAVHLADAFLAPLSEDAKAMLQPDLLISFGLSHLSKNLKIFLRRFSPAAHWHVQPEGSAPDMFQSLTQVIHCDPEAFFSCLADVPAPKSHAPPPVYQQSWRGLEQWAHQQTHRFFDQHPSGEFAAVRDLLAALPPGSALHLANSMPIRYANLVGLAKDRNVEVFANRGTSGIDGCTSTAVGHCLADTRLQVLLTGDVAFFYDSNAFWHDADLKNLRIVLLNNRGGAIFGMIDGPAGLPELERFFLTTQQRSARSLCAEFNIRYQRYESQQPWHGFFAAEGPALMEVESTTAESIHIFQQYKQFLQATLYEPQVSLDPR